MRIHARPSRRRLDRITLNLASMIDVTFLLLVYFIISTVIMHPEDRLTPALQTQREGGAATDFQPQIIDVIMHEGVPAYRLGGRLILQREELGATLRQLPMTEGLFINVADDAPVGFAVAAMQEARNAGFEQVTYVPQR